MQLYAIRRRNAWASADELKATAERSAQEGDKDGSGVRWIRSYVVSEDDGTLGTVCIYEADSPRPSGPTPPASTCRPTRLRSSPTPSSCGPTLSGRRRRRRLRTWTRDVRSSAATP